MLCRIHILQIQPRKHVLAHEDYTAPSQKHELDHTDKKLSSLKYVDHEAEIDDLSDV